MHLSRYSGRMIECGYLSEAKFEAWDFSPEPLIKIEKPSGEFEGLEKYAIDFNA